MCVNVLYCSAHAKLISSRDIEYVTKEMGMDETCYIIHMNNHYTYLTVKN